MTRRTELLELKIRLLVEGINVDIEECRPHWKERIEHLYHHDGGRPRSAPYPQEIVVHQEPNAPELNTVVNVRLNQRSAYRLHVDGNGQLLLSGQTLDEYPVAAVSRPDFYSRVLQDGTKVPSVVQHLGQDTVGVVPNNYCVYFADGDECKFCEISASYKDSRTFPRMRKSYEVIADALSVATRDPDVRHTIITSGNYRTNNETAQLYCRIVSRLADASGEHYYFGSLMAPDNLDQIALMKDCGLNGVAFNLEFFAPEQFTRLAPGKARFGRERMLVALAKAAEMFGRGNAFSNMVYGIQSWRGAGQTVDHAAESAVCKEATETLLGLGVVPLFTIYHYSGRNSIGPVQLD